VDRLHEEFSILPKSFETVQKHVVKCSSKLASAFSRTMAIACGQKPPDGAFNSNADLEDYAWDNARILPANRNLSENIVWLWIYTFMIIIADADIARIRGRESGLPKPTLLKIATDLGRYLLASVTDNGSQEKEDGLDPVHNIMQRTWHCIVVLAQLHAIGTATAELITSTDSESLLPPAESRSLVSEPIAFLSGGCRFPL
jgi:hypothetical protein